jgi:hypothetical protein
MAAREVGDVSLADALALTLLTAEVGDDRWPRAAARWLGRFIVESPAITIGEAALAAAAIQELAGSESRDWLRRRCGNLLQPMAEWCAQPDPCDRSDDPGRDGGRAARLEGRSPYGI